MSSGRPSQENFISIARIVKPQGRRGEVAAELHTNFPELFAERRNLELLLPTGERQNFELEAHWLHKGRVVLKFRGVDSISDAERLAGGEVQIARTQRAQLEPGSAYISDLTGCEVFDRGRLLGKIAAVQFGAGEAPLLEIQAAIKHGSEGERELLLPFAAEYIKSLDVAAKRVEMILPEGMLELDAPFSEKKKSRRRGEGAEKSKERG